MSKISLNFHAKREEIFDLVEEAMITFDLSIITVKLFPFERETIYLKEFNNKIDILKNSEIVFLCKIMPKELSEEYWELAGQNKDSLVIHLGEQNDNCIKESSMGTIADDEESLEIWKKIIKKFKKKMLKGAWIYNPNSGVKKFYKNQYYTIGARQAFENGCKIVHIGGMLEYHLTNEKNYTL